MSETAGPPNVKKNLESEHTNELGNSVKTNGERTARPFLRKGEGLNRFYKGKQPKPYIAKRKSIPLENETPGVISNQNRKNGEDLADINSKLYEEKDSGIATGGKDVEADDELKMFEALEQAAVSASFCSTSSLAARFLQTNFAKLKFAKADEYQTRLTEQNAEVFSFPSSLFGSEVSDLEGENEEGDNSQEEEGDSSANEDDYLDVRTQSKEEQFHTLPTFDNVRKPTPVFAQHSRDDSTATELELLRRENSSLKARIIYLEEKTEKNTLDWWSHKEQIVQIIHSLQNTISRRDSQLENVQLSLTKKIESLEEDLRSRSQKWIEKQLEIAEKISFVEDELHVSNQDRTTIKNKLQRNIDLLHKELRDRTAEWISARELLENRVVEIENETVAARSSNLLPRQNAPKCLSDYTSEPTETLNDNVFGSDAEETDQCQVNILPNGDKETVYPNGTRKVVTSNLAEMKHFYTNGDVRVLKRDGTIKYFYAETGTWQTTYTNGVEYYEFANGQVERRNPNGVSEIVFTNGCVKYAHPSGREECIFSDNTILRVDPNGERTVLLPNGQQEIYGSDYKKRVYPDGTIKTVYNDGTQETRYPNGRIRIKNAQGDLLADHNTSSKPSKGDTC